MSSQKEQEERLGKFASSLNSNTPINQIWNSIRQLKGKDRKELNMLEVNGAHYKDSKNLANKIGDTLAEPSLPKIYDSNF